MKSFLQFNEEIHNSGLFKNTHVDKAIIKSPKLKKPMKVKKVIKKIIRDLKKPDIANPQKQLYQIKRQAFRHKYTPSR